MLKSNKSIGQFAIRLKSVRVVDGCTKCLAVRKRGEVPFLHFHGNAELFFLIVDSFVSQQQQKAGTYYCVSIATVVMQTRHSVTYHVHYITCSVNNTQSLATVLLDTYCVSICY
jgi:hypothetical protein